MVRYADDFVVVSNGPKAEVKATRLAIQQFLENEPHLTLSEEKTVITHVNDGFDFLGFHSHTDATIYTCASSNCQQNWTHEQNNYGDTNDYAYTESYAYIKNPPPHDIYVATTRWNTYYTSGNDEFIARHEIGHGLGFGHPSTCINSVMINLCATPWPSTLQSHDIADINAEY